MVRDGGSVRTTGTWRDWTRGLQVVVSLAAVGTVLAVLFWVAATLFYAVQRAGGPSDVTIGATLPRASHVDPEPSSPGLPASVGLSTGSALPVAIRAPSMTQYALAVLERVPTLIVYATFFVLLWRLLRHARRDDPFSATVARRLRRLGALLSLGALAAALVEAVAAGLLSAQLLPAHGFLFNYDLPGGALIGGVGLLAIAHLIARGAHMREDLAGTV